VNPLCPRIIYQVTVDRDHGILDGGAKTFVLELELDKCDDGFGNDAAQLIEQRDSSDTDGRLPILGVLAGVCRQPCRCIVP